MASERPVMERELAHDRRSSPTISGMELRSDTMKSVPQAPTTTETAISAAVRIPSGAKTSNSITAACATFVHSMRLLAVNRARRPPAASPARNPDPSRTAMNRPIASALPVVS